MICADSEMQGVARTKPKHMLIRKPGRRAESALELFEKAGKVRISACRRAPAHVPNLGVLASEIRGEYLKSGVDHAGRPF
jgi:hypothetical protein